jgi:putative ABC transport system substrate-binding protein
MQRREFIGLIGAAALSFPRPGYAQTKTDLPVVGLLMTSNSETNTAKERVAALRKGLQEAGFVEGTNYSLAVRFAEGDVNRLPQLARELGALNPRVFVTLGFGAAPAQRSSPEIPMVFTGVAADPIALGWVQSYSHPGGMITGNVMNAVGGEVTMTQKRIGLFKQLVPSLTRLGMIAPINGVFNGVLAMKEKESATKSGRPVRL